MVIMSAVTAADPIPVAHRGLAQYAPENTEAAYRACIALQLGAEIDVRRTKNGDLVCLHDDTLDRTTNLKGKLTELDDNSVLYADAGSWFHPSFSKENVPTLGEILRLGERQFHPRLIALDIKVFDERFAKDLATVIAESNAATDRLVCIGLAIDRPEVRKALKDADREIPVAVLAQTAEDLPAAIADKHSDWVYVRFVPTVEEVANCHKAGKKVFAAGAKFAGKDHVENWKASAAAGVDAILTDYPLEMRAALRKKPAP